MLIFAQATRQSGLLKLFEFDGYPTVHSHNQDLPRIELPPSFENERQRIKQSRIWISEMNCSGVGRDALLRCSERPGKPQKVFLPESRKFTDFASVFVTNNQRSRQEKSDHGMCIFRSEGKVIEDNLTKKGPMPVKQA